ncbi:hypothetical protein C0995_009675 [Termitomyces sp. Mi166|nr:hypothetical protein C0995_009675 [Termitomyces sp. Mi166\
MSRNWQYLAASKKSRQQASIPKEWILMDLPSSNESNVLTFPDACGLLTPQEVEITNTHVDMLLKKLASAEWTSVAVTTAFGKRAIIAHQLDQLNIKGIESTIGYASLVGKYAERNAVLVDVLEALGAVLTQSGPKRTTSYLAVLSTLATVLSLAEVPLEARVHWSHLRVRRSVIWSSFAILTILANVFDEGVGSDVGGSIRVPSGFCGTYGFRPSHGRVPYAGAVNSLEGQDTIPSVLGPLSNSIHGLKIFIQGVLSQKSWFKDPLVIRKGWSEEQYNLSEHGEGKRLCFAVMWNDGEVVPHPPIIRGLEMAKNALIKAGHKVIDWKPLDHKIMLDVGFSIFSAGSAEDFAAISAESGEPLITSMVPGKEITDIDPSTMILTRAPLSAYELWQLQKKKRDLRQGYLEHWLATASETGTGRPVDAIIVPVAPFTAVPHGEESHVGYTMVWNVLDCPALVIPVSRVDPMLDVRKPAHEFLSDSDKAIYDLYEPETFKDAPIAFQIVGMPQEDEAVIAMAEIVDAAMKAL